jgi:hypothetical protein
MHRELESAFRRTRYRVLTPDAELLLRVDQRAPALADLLRKSGASCAALLTAFNPAGSRYPPFRNRQWQRQLGRELARQGHVLLPARNEDPRGLWPTEASLLVLDLPPAEARRIAARYRQVAFLWLDAAGTPRLIFTAVSVAAARPCGSQPRPRRYCPTQPTA